MTDRQLNMVWMSFRQGDTEAFYQLYEQFADQLYNYGIRITSDNALVEDCIHDLFVELWEKRERLGTIHSFKHYSYTALRRKIFRALQKERKFSSLKEPSYDFRLEPSLSHEDLMAKQEYTEEQSHKLQQALSTLSTRQKEVIFLRYFDCFSNDEIAAIMSITIESVYKLISKAISSIKKHITELSLLLWFLLLNI